ncbi:MAG: hypothetical protein COA61_006410 [Zetaproteobacteria bacterium]|nr:hypothetical protein [Zetaproteobacteria bacterium]
MSIFEQSIETEDCGMCASTTHYTIEDIYNAFKERMDKENAETRNLLAKCYDNREGLAYEHDILDAIRKKLGI